MHRASISPRGNQAHAYTQHNMNQPQQLFQVMNTPRPMMPMMNMPMPMATYQGTPNNQQTQPNMVPSNQQMQQYVGQGYHNQ